MTPLDTKGAREIAVADVGFARTVIDKYGADSDKPSVRLALAVVDGAHERDRLRALLKRACDLLSTTGGVHSAIEADAIRAEGGIE